MKIRKLFSLARFSFSIIISLLAFGNLPRAIAQETFGGVLVLDKSTNEWLEVGKACCVVGMTYGDGKIWAANTYGDLWVSSPNMEKIEWKKISKACCVVGMAYGNGKLWAANNKNDLWVGKAVEGPIDWKFVRKAINVVGMAYGNGKLWAANSMNELWVRDDTEDGDVNWRKAGKAWGVVAMTYGDGKLWAVNKNNQLWFRSLTEDDVNWTKLRDVLPGIVGLAYINGQLWATTKNPQPSISPGGGRGPGGSSGGSGAGMNRQSVCIGTAPSGWIKVDMSWNATSTCPTLGSMIPNEMTIERFDNRPIGSTISACAGPVPGGWTLLGTSRDIGRCETSLPNDNVMRIRRIN